jgi:hypothetical protein
MRLHLAYRSFRTLFEAVGSLQGAVISMPHIGSVAGDLKGESGSVKALAAKNAALVILQSWLACRAGKHGQQAPDLATKPA